MAAICIVGANRGIGLALTRIYANRGDQIIAGCRVGSAELSALDVRVVEGLEVTDDGAVESWAREVAGTKLDPGTQPTMCSMASRSIQTGVRRDLSCAVSSRRVPIVTTSAP